MITSDELENWAGTFMLGLEDAPAGEVHTVLGANHGNDMVLAGVGEDYDETLINTFFQDAQQRKVLAMAAYVRWSPTPLGESSDAWVATIVALDLEAIFVVKRVAEDENWWVLEPDQVPWMVLSTAAGLRKILTEGGELVLKTANKASDPRLFSTIHDEPPAADENGRI